MWKPFEEGRSIGTNGSEQGTIILDDEHSDGARITLEKECRGTPFAVTCGVYGWMVHTCFFATEDIARRTYAAMKEALSAMLARFGSDPDIDLVADLCEDFMERFGYF